MISRLRFFDVWNFLKISFTAYFLISPSRKRTENSNSEGFHVQITGENRQVYYQRHLQYLPNAAQSEIPSSFSGPRISCRTNVLSDLNDAFQFQQVILKRAFNFLHTEVSRHMFDSDTIFLDVKVYRMIEKITYPSETINIIIRNERYTDKDFAEPSILHNTQR